MWGGEGGVGRVCVCVGRVSECVCVGGGRGVSDV